MATKKSRASRRKTPRARPGIPLATSGVSAQEGSPSPNLSPKSRTGEKMGIRAVEAALGNKVTTIRGRTTIEATDSGIPFSAVPYFISDLRRIALIGGLALLLLFSFGIYVLPRILSSFSKF